MPFEMKQLTITLSNEQYEEIKQQAILANKDIISFVTDNILKNSLIPKQHSLDINE